MSIASAILRLMGWNVDISIPDYPKCLICVAPHTSNWDFVMGKLAYASIGRHAGFMMKSTWFFPPLGWIFRAMGGIPVYRSNNGKHPSMVDQVSTMMRQRDKLQIAITPEGTRSRTSQWHTGILRIAYNTGVPIVLATIDYQNKRITASHAISASGNHDLDMTLIKSHYKASQAKHPKDFDNSFHVSAKNCAPETCEKGTLSNPT